MTSPLQSASLFHATLGATALANAGCNSNGGTSLAIGVGAAFALGAAALLAYRRLTEQRPAAGPAIARPAIPRPELPQSSEPRIDESAVLSSLQVELGERYPVLSEPQFVSLRNVLSSDLMKSWKNDGSPKRVSDDRIESAIQGVVRHMTPEKDSASFGPLYRGLTEGDRGRRPRRAVSASETPEVAPVADLSPEEEDLKQRLTTEAGFFLYGKMPKTHDDFSIIGHRNIIPEALPKTKYDTSVMRQLLLGLEQMCLDRDDETLVYLKKGSLLSEFVANASDGPATHLRYGRWSKEGDFTNRPIVLSYVFIASEELGNQVLDYVQKNPQRAHPFFTSFVTNPQYTFNKPKGRLIVVDAGQTPPDARGRRMVDILQTPKLWKALTY